MAFCFLLGLLIGLFVNHKTQREAAPAVRHYKPDSAQATKEGLENVFEQDVKHVRLELLMVLSGRTLKQEYGTSHVVVKDSENEICGMLAEDNETWINMIIRFNEGMNEFILAEYRKANEGRDS